MTADPTSPFHIALVQAQRNIIKYALETADNDWHLACSRLGLSQGHFKYYCEKLGFPLPDKRKRRVGASADQVVEEPNKQDADDENPSGDGDVVEDLA